MFFGSYFAQYNYTKNNKFGNNMTLKWQVTLHEAFEPEVDNLPSNVKIELYAHALLLERFGPSLGRPYVDTLHGVNVSNLKELRFRSDGGVWRVLFAFCPTRDAILLVAGNKCGVNQKRFYQKIIKIAESRFTSHLKTINTETIK